MNRLKAFILLLKESPLSALNWAYYTTIYVLFVGISLQHLNTILIGAGSLLNSFSLLFSTVFAVYVAFETPSSIFKSER